jgi:nucleoid DNA-binding protein
VVLTQMQLISAVAERADLRKNDAKRARTGLDESVLKEFGDAQKVRIGD